MRTRKVFAKAFLRLYQSKADLSVAWIMFVPIGTAVFSIVCWRWLNDGESGSTSIVNLGLVIAANIGLPLAIWRSKVAERQAATAQHQSETAQRGPLNECYPKGARLRDSRIRFSALLVWSYWILISSHSHSFFPSLAALSMSLTAWNKLRSS